MAEVPVQEIARLVGGTIEGEDSLVIRGVETVDRAAAGDLTFIGSQKYLHAWAESRASAALIDATLEAAPGPGRALIRVSNADLAMALVLERLSPPAPQCPEGIHATAVIDGTARLGDAVSIGPHCYVGPDCAIGDGCRLYANVTLLDEVTIGAGTVLFPGVVVRERCRIGRNCILQANVTVGTDGFGYRPSADGKRIVKVPHIGTVEIGDDVEIGSNACIDRGKFSATAIGDGTKLDNLVQVAHNCRLGRMVLISGLSGLSGTVTVGDGVMLGGNTGVADHVTIGAGARVGGKSGVMRDVPPGRYVLGYPALDARHTMRVWAALQKLPELMRHVKRLLPSLGHD